MWYRYYTITDISLFLITFCSPIQSSNVGSRDIIYYGGMGWWVGWGGNYRWERTQERKGGCILVLFSYKHLHPLKTKTRHVIVMNDHVLTRQQQQ